MSSVPKQTFNFHWLLLSLCSVVLAGVLSGVLLSGCSTEQETSSGNKLLAEPMLDQRLAEDDFGFPSKSPSLKMGAKVFQSECVKCHVSTYFQQEKVKQDLNVTTPIDLYLMLSSGKGHPVVNPSPQRQQVLPAKHPAFRELSRDERWAVLFYARYLAGAADIQGPATAPTETVASIYGGNCAVCHGTRGLADGPLYSGKTGNHHVANAEVKNNFLPPPANFHDHYSRMYNRSDAQLLKYICEGIYPSAMPSWFGNVHRDAATGKMVYVFNEQLISNLIRHVRLFAYENDLSTLTPSEQKALGINPDIPPKGLTQFGSCHVVGSNQPWTQAMHQYAPASAKTAAESVPAAPTLSSEEQAKPKAGASPL